MKFTEKDKEVYGRISETLRKREATGALEEGDISNDDLNYLLDNPNPDLATLGTDLLAILPSQPSPKTLQGENAIRNYTRFIIANTLTIKEKKLKLPAELSDISFFRSNFNDLSKRVIPFSLRPQPAQIQSTEVTTIIVHGTWAASSSWWQKNGDFWNYINGITNNVYSGPDPYSWSGSNNHEARVTGAHNLILWCQSHFIEHVDIIAHSHGGNVCLYASMLGLKIRKLILMGTPIRLEYLPRFRNIKEIHNIFSTADLVQKAGTFPNPRFEGRTLGDSVLPVINYRAEDDGSGGNPGHTELHDPEVWMANNFEAILTS